MMDMMDMADAIKYNRALEEAAIAFCNAQTKNEANQAARMMLEVTGSVAIHVGISDSCGQLKTVLDALYEFNEFPRPENNQILFEAFSDAGFLYADECDQNELQELYNIENYLQTREAAVMRLKRKREYEHLSPMKMRRI